MNLMILFMIFVFTLKFQPTDAMLLKNVNGCFPKKDDQYPKLINNLINGSLSGKAWDWLEQICDDYGHRVAGSEAEKQVFKFFEDNAKADGFDNVHTEEVIGIPHFERGNDKVTVLTPRKVSLPVLALPGTPNGTVEADVLVLTSEEEFYKTNVTGKIVVFVFESWTNYSTAVRARFSGLFVAQKGGVGVLVKSITPFSLGTLHTGRGGYGKFDIPIPAASITLEDAEMLLRWYRRGKQIKIRMEIESQTLPESLKSQNLIFDIKGTRFPNEIVVLSANLDTWDVGQGALNNGGGCVSIYYALKAILELSKTDCRFKPQRTLRGILWTGKEKRFVGAKQYFDRHWEKQTEKGIEDFFFVSESAGGALKPTNHNSTLDFKGTEAQMKTIKKVVDVLNNYGIPLSTKFRDYQGDVQDFANKGVPSVGYTPDRGLDWYYYFDRSNADYVNVIEKEDLDYTAAIFAVLAQFFGSIPNEKF